MFYEYIRDRAHPRCTVLCIPKSLAPRCPAHRGVLCSLLDSAVFCPPGCLLRIYEYVHLTRIRTASKNQNHFRSLSTLSLTESFDRFVLRFKGIYVKMPLVPGPFILLNITLSVSYLLYTVITVYSNEYLRNIRFFKIF